MRQNKYNGYIHGHLSFNFSETGNIFPFNEKSFNYNDCKNFHSIFQVICAIRILAQL